MIYTANKEIDLLEFDSSFIKLEQSILNEGVKDNIKEFFNHIIEKLKRAFDFISEKIKKVIKKRNILSASANPESIKYYEYAFLDDDLNFDGLMPISKVIYKFIESHKWDISGIAPPPPDRSILDKIAHSDAFINLSSDDSNNEMYNSDIIEFIKGIYKFYDVSYSTEILNCNGINNLFNNLKNDTISITKEMVRKNLSSYAKTTEWIDNYDKFVRTHNHLLMQFEDILNESKKLLRAIQSDVQKLELNNTNNDRESEIKHQLIKLKGLKTYTKLVNTLLDYIFIDMSGEFLKHIEVVHRKLIESAAKVANNSGYYAKKAANEEAYLYKQGVFENIEFI